MKRKIKTFVCAGFALVASGASHAARAYQFCVSTAAELRQALSDVSDGGAHAGEYNLIRLAFGTFATNGTPFTYTSTSLTDGLTIEGDFDYHDDCASTRYRAARTVLDGGGTSQVLRLNQASGTIELGWVTIQNGDTDADGAGLSINAAGVTYGTFLVEGTIIRDNHSSGIGGGVFARGQADAGNPQLTFSGNLLSGNSAAGGSGAGRIVASGAMSSVIENNTVVNNSTALSGGTGGLHAGGSGTGTFVDNIFWGNTNFGVYIGGYDHITFDYNDVGAMDGQAADESVGNLSLNPRFVDAANEDFHLAGDSPLIAATPYLFGTYLPDGHFMASTGRGDIGAYQETIFTDGFDD